jgi:hypothetical protein
MPGAGNWVASSATSAAIRSRVASSLAFTAWTPSSIQRPISSISPGPTPRLVTEGVPSRMPEGLNGLRGS